MSIIPHEKEQNSRSVAMSYFDYQDALAFRQMALVHGVDLPKYLLAPEIAVILNFLPDLRQRLFFDTLWNTGARLNECLALTPVDFDLDNGDRPFVVLRTLKQRSRGKGRPRKDEAIRRIVPLLDAAYVQRLREYFATVRPLRSARVWGVANDETPRNWLKAALNRAERDGVTFTFTDITPRTFRHSFAMHLIQHQVPMKVVQAYMGHRELSSTEIYTKIFALDVGQQYGVSFSIPLDAVASLLGRKQC